MTPLPVTSLVIDRQVLSQIFSSRIEAAVYLEETGNSRAAHAAKMVRWALETLQAEIEGSNRFVSSDKERKEECI